MRADGSPLIGTGMYSRLQVQPPCSEFIPYQPEIFPELRTWAKVGESAVAKLKKRLHQVRLNSKARRKMLIEAEAAEAIATFGKESSDDEDESCRFWHELKDVEARNIFRHTTSLPNPVRGAGPRQSRTARLARF